MDVYFSPDWHWQNFHLVSGNPGKIVRFTKGFKEPLPFNPGIIRAWEFLGGYIFIYQLPKLLWVYFPGFLGFKPPGLKKILDFTEGKPSQVKQRPRKPGMAKVG